MPQLSATALNDVHCHFFSNRFFTALVRGLAGVSEDRAAQVALERLGWEPPGTADQLADRWAAELEGHQVGRAVLIASVPGDAESAGAAVRRHPTRFVGFFMVDPTQPAAHAAAADAIDRFGLRGICLFPAMHHYALHDERVRYIFDVAAARPRVVVFVHCGVLSVGARRRLGLPSPFDIRRGNPLDLHHLAASYPAVPIIVPHFGAGMFREALMLADVCSNVLFDTSSSNGWVKYQSPELTLKDVFRQALAVAGPDRLLFGTDSSFFPRGWVADVFNRQSAALDELGVSADIRQKIFGGNFDRVLPA